MPEEVLLLRVLAVLSNTRWLDILCKLKTPALFPTQDEGDLATDRVCVSSILAGQGLAFSTTSKYLADRDAIGLVTIKRMGKWSYYKRGERAIAALAKRLARKL